MNLSQQISESLNTRFNSIIVFFEKNTFIMKTYGGSNIVIVDETVMKALYSSHYL